MGEWVARRGPWKSETGARGGASTGSVEEMRRQEVGDPSGAGYGARGGRVERRATWRKERRGEGARSRFFIHF